LRTLTGIFAVGSLILSLLTGCGGGSGDSAEGQAIDKATFVKQANDICEKTSGKLAAGLVSISSRESAKPDYDYTKTQIVIVEEVFIPGLEEELMKIRMLGIPTDGAKEAKALLNAYEAGIAKTKTKVKAVVKGAVPYEGVELAASRLGASECPIAPVNAS
jgi:hypothetical protein